MRAVDVGNCRHVVLADGVVEGAADAGGAGGWYAALWCISLNSLVA